jgi:hypothetical protein
MSTKKIITVGLPSIFIKTFQSLENLNIIPKKKRSKIIREAIKDGINNDLPFFSFLTELNVKLQQKSNLKKNMANIHDT